MITIYSRDDCPWCDRAKEMISMNGESYEEIKIGRDMKMLSVDLNNSARITRVKRNTLIA